MSERNYPAAGETKQARRTGRKNTGLKVVLFLLSLAVWCGMVYGGFYYSKQYLDQSILKIQQTNAMNIQELNDRLINLAAEMQDLKKLLSNTDQTLSSSGSLQRDLNAKINMLDQQLQNLEKSLKILKEAP